MASNSTYDQHKTHALAMRTEGYTYVQIAQAIGCSPSLVGKWVRKAGMGKSKAVHYTAAVRRAAINRYLAGESSKVIAKKLGIASHSTVVRWLREEDIPVRGISGYANPRKTPESLVTFCRRMYDMGYTHVEIGEMVGKHPTAVGRLMREAGYRGRSKHEQMKISIAKGRHPLHLRNKKQHATL